MGKRTVLLATAVALVVGAAALAIWWWTRLAPVDLVRPIRGPAVELVYATGFVEPVAPVTVASRLTAPVARVLVDEGDRVRRGQALLLLDDEEQRGALTEAQARSTGATLAENRLATLFRQGWVTKAAFDGGQADARAARAAARSARARLDQTVIRAQIDGIVTKRDIEPGELASPGRSLLLLGDPSHVRVTATVDERDVARLRIGQAAWLSNDAWPGRRLPGRVIALTPSGDPNQRAFRVRLSADTRRPLLLGMTFEVNIVVRERAHALLVPAGAVSGGTLWVSVAGRARQRPVRLGIMGPERVEILQNLGADEWVVDHPAADLREGQRITAVR